MSDPQIIGSDFDLVPVGERIRLTREHFGLSQQQFGEKLGFSRRQLIAWENAANAPPIALLAAIRRQFDIDPEWVLLGPGRKPLRDVGLKGTDRRKRVEKDVAKLVEAAGLRLSRRVMDSLVELILEEEPEDEKQARQKMLKTLRSMAMDMAK